ncbi:serine/threonine protein kinase [Labilithrix luteola]|uniref:Serine/threonine protein kinase n=1 Tax=Labilithrix luteola TaxID=1391654 RepID=A0A0K1PZV6_9BACT|nr:serine/threonine-protein kinase [Labilithrix luteola]AKU98916.1 serine/threonine protein kinase [Labilithrix luteola]
MSDDADVLLPVLVAELADEDARRMVEEFARARRTVLVPLVDPPGDASLHVLEVTTPGNPEPLLVMAQPVGAPTERGFPLRLRAYDPLRAGPPSSKPPPPINAPRPSASFPPSPSSAPPSSVRGMPSLRATRARPATLTAHHTRDLVRPPQEADDELLAEDLTGRELAGGKFVVEEQVGTGGMGVVYRARHKQLGTPLAVKVLHERFRRDLAFCARFQAEALAVSQLDHANVVRIFDYGQEPDGLLYLAMDFLRGVELEEVVVREGALPLERIIDIAMQVSAGLGHAHGRGIVHRDVKPSNIILVKTDDDEGRAVELVKVCDFGIAAHTGTRGLVGTPAYMSPEQCEGREVDGRSDIYALGIILYELATGQLPFTGPTPADVAQLHLHKPPPPPALIRPVDPRLEELILRMLRKWPSERPGSMREVRAALRHIEAGSRLELHSVGAGASARERGSSPPQALSSPVPSRTSSTSSTLGMAPVDIPALAALLTTDPAAALRERLATPAHFANEARAVAAAMRVMLSRAEYEALARVVAIFRHVAETTADPRAELSSRVVRTLEDPALLGPAAEHVLSSEGDAAPRFLSMLGLAAAHALYAVRIRSHPTPTLRTRFVATLRAIGAPAWPLVSLALERNAPGEARKHDPRLAEDLLRGMVLPDQDVGHNAPSAEGLGTVVAACIRWGDPAVRRAAIGPLVRLWGDRSRALLFGLFLKDPEEDVRIAALIALRELRAIDEHIVRRGEQIFAGEPPSTLLRVAVAEALADANEAARPLAIGILRRALGTKPEKRSSTGPKTTAPVILAVARSFALLGGPEAANHIESLGRQYEEPLRTQLLGLVGARS